MTLTGQVALVTGAVRDIGRAIALQLAQDGADVAVADLRADLLRDTAAAITGHGRRSLAVPVDVTQKPQVEAMVQQVVSTFGRLDVFFNNAGVMKIHDFLDITEADWDWIMDINAIPYRTAQTS